MTNSNLEFLDYRAMHSSNYGDQRTAYEDLFSSYLKYLERVKSLWFLVIAIHLLMARGTPKEMVTFFR
jgi:hypothetical protein